MASITINGGLTFAEGVSVGVYPRNRWGIEGLTGAPSGSAVATATVTSGVLTFTGLLDGTEYVAYAASPDRYRRFSTAAASVLTDGGLELGYAEKADANYTTTNTAATDIGSGTSITFTAGSRPVAIRFGASDIFHSVANTIVQLTAVRTDTSAIITFFRGTHATANGRIPLGSHQARMSGLTPGSSYTVKLQSASGAAGTITIPASVNNPIWIQAVEL